MPTEDAVRLALRRRVSACLFWTAYWLIGGAQTVHAHNDGELLRENLGLVLAMFFGALGWLLYMAYRVTRPNSVRQRYRRMSAYSRWARWIMEHWKRLG